jgi:arylsulfatase
MGSHPRRSAGEARIHQRAVRKWFLGNYSGRFPNDQGFDEWYGLAPRADGEQTVAVTPTRIRSHISSPARRPMRHGPFRCSTTRPEVVFNREITDRSIDFIKRNAKSKHPFFLYVPVSGLHPPLYCAPELAGKSGACGVGDALLQIDQSVGRILDAISEAGLASKTIFILTSNSGPEFRERWRGTAGPWSGNSNTAMEGSLRVPFLIRWPRHVPAGRVSNEIVHIVDVFTTLAAAANAPIPTDRVIDGVNQLDFFTGKQPTSNRESFPIFVRGKLYAEKWRDWKMHYIWWPEQDTRPVVGVTCLFNLRSDPQEKHNVLRDNPEVTATINQIVTDFWSGVAKEPLIKPGTPDPYQPTKN